MGNDGAHDRGATRRRCLQFWYAHTGLLFLAHAYPIVVVDLKTYPDAVFLFLMTAGVYIIRRHRSRIGVGRSEFRAWDAAVVLYLLVNLFLLVMPWYPPEGGATGGDVSFWYGTYCVVGIGM